MGPMMRRLLLGVVLMLATTAWARPRKPLVIVISLDGFPARIMARKTPALFQDAFIAATARVHRLTMATRNVRDSVHFEVPTFNPFTYSN
jgi:hypothetical protein